MGLLWAQDDRELHTPSDDTKVQQYEQFVCFVGLVASQIASHSHSRSKTETGVVAVTIVVLSNSSSLDAFVGLWILQYVVYYYHEYCTTTTVFLSLVSPLCNGSRYTKKS